MSLSEYTTKDLSEWDDKICEIAHNYGLDWLILITKFVIITK